MRLLTKSLLYFISTSPIVLLLGGIVFYFQMQTIIYEEVDERLLEQKSALQTELRIVKSFDKLAVPTDGSIVISTNIDSSLINAVEPLFTDTLMYVETDNELLPFRELTFIAYSEDELRTVSIFRSLIETDDLIEVILTTLALIFLVTIILFAALNYFTMHRLWQPFHKIMEQVQQFDFRSRAGFEPVHTNITEFNSLNNELMKLTTKLKHDFNALKEFSENASHEMQTPLAIMQAKLELLFQQSNFEEENLKALKAAYDAAGRLSRLHHELNLLTRIENKEFTDQSVLNIQTLWQEQIDNFMDIVEMKNLILDTKFNASPEISGNRHLLEIMLSNLFNNAIKHNLENGHITIEINSNSFSISNSGPTPDFPPESLFERFRKGKAGSGSTGLGLSLVKQICLVHDFQIHYSIQNKLHNITVSF